jgi:Uma2 family endonuclease
LVAEVVSERGEARDYQEKRDEYLRFGIHEYWIVDSIASAVTVLVRREADGSATWTEQVFRGADLIVSALLPGYTGSVAELWANVDREENASD